MAPEPGNPFEIEGVLNPAVIRGPDGQLYLFPRIVGKGNYSRIGIARVLFNGMGDPVGVERLGIALEPEAEYEFRDDGSGGCEDPRITFIEPLGQYIMTYCAFSSRGPRIALAISKDLFQWKRLGLAVFESFRGIEFAHVDNKDAVLFPIAIPNHAGKLQMAILHRPLFAGSRPEETAELPPVRQINLDNESIWISYCPMTIPNQEFLDFGTFNSHHRLATPVSPWETLKIGTGTPPILTPHGWLVIYHGVSNISEDTDKQVFCYSAGLMILSKTHPSKIVYRSTEPILTPKVIEECYGKVNHVVFPTGIDCRHDIGLPNRFDVYYGMADNLIGVARLDLPYSLPQGAPADSPTLKVMKPD